MVYICLSPLEAWSLSYLTLNESLRKYSLFFCLCVHPLFVGLVALGYEMCEKYFPSWRWRDTEARANAHWSLEDFLFLLGGLGREWRITSIFLHIYQPRPELDTYRNMRRGGCWPWKCRNNVLLVWQIPHEGIFPLPAHLIPPCHPTGTPTEYPSTDKRQSCGPCTSESNSASQSGLLLERYKCRVSSFHSGTACSHHTSLCTM